MKNSASIPAFIVKPMDSALASDRFSTHARVALELGAVRGVDVADEPRDAVPRDRPTERPGRSRGPATSSMSDSSIRTKPSIDEPSNMMSPVERLLELGGRDLDVLVDPQDVGELEPEKPDPLFLCDVQNFRFLQFLALFACVGWLKYADCSPDCAS